MAQSSSLSQVVLVAQSSPQPQPTRSEVAMAILFVPLVIGVLWLSWWWRRDYRQMRQKRSDLP